MQVVRSHTRLFLRSEKKSRGKPLQFFTYFGSTLMHKMFCRHLFHTKMFGNFKRSLRARRFGQPRLQLEPYCWSKCGQSLGGFKDQLCCSNNRLFNVWLCCRLCDYWVWSFEHLNLCLSQTYLVDYCSHGESRKKKYHHFKCANIIILPMRTTNKHTLPLPSKQPTL